MRQPNCIVLLIGLLCALLLCHSPLMAQCEGRFMFYNVENLFDINNDSLTADDEFTHRGQRAWTYKKYQHKLLNIFKVISAVGNPLPPDIVALCEIENRQVLKALTQKTPLCHTPYLIVQEESPDRRGIDVALLFKPEYVRLLQHKAIPLHFPFDSLKTTRDILYVKLLWHQRDTLHLFVNHWPSRWGGALATNVYRCYAAQQLKSHCDSLLSVNNHAKLIIMGDFNDAPTNESLQDILIGKDGSLHNLMHQMQAVGKGTHKHELEWACLDQIIVSSALLPANSSACHIKWGEAHIFNADFLLMPDKKYLGEKPYRTWNGFKYIGGFSDHLPVYIDVVRKP